jgi:membrane protein YqaA with SNARE-associated domain
MVDSSPLPTFGGLDILTAILAARHEQPWFYFAAIATAGSVLGAFFTFRAAHKAGASYLERKFGKRRVTKLMKRFEHWGTGALIVSTAVPFPFPTSFFFAAAGVMKYPLGRFMAVVAAGRGIRYSLVSYVAALYGRQFIHQLRNPQRFYEWTFAIVLLLMSVGVIALLLRGRVRNLA